METEIIKKVTGLRERIEKAKAERNKLEGKLSGMLERLKSDYGCSDVAEALEKINEIEASIQEKEKVLQSRLSELKAVL